MRCFHCMNSIPDGAALCPYCNETPSKENPPYCLTAGTVLKNKYIIGNVIGEGGFGITYAGWDLALGQKIAVKEYYPSICANRSHTGDNQVIPGQASKGQYFRMGKERFTQEAQSAAQFSGEAGIVKILDYFEENDTAYIVMNYVEGGNLGEIVRSRGKFEPKTFFAAVLPLMRTLEHVHQTGMIHRDIAPDNIIMSQDGSLTLLDFGSARYYFGAETKSLSVILKQGYAPYEQYSRKGHQGAWTDVYALCATIYKCITGETPPDALDRAINDELKKPSELGVKLSPHIEAVLLNGMAIHFQNRIQNMYELMEMLIQATEQDGAEIKKQTSNSDYNPKENHFTIIDEVKIQRKKAKDENLSTKLAETLTYDNYSKENLTNINIQSSETKKKKLFLKIIVSAILLTAAVISLAFVFTIIKHFSTNDANVSSNASKHNQLVSTNEENNKTTSVNEIIAATASLKQQGITGDCHWLIYEDGTMIIDGNGEMSDYAYQEAPWYSERSSVKKIVINSGVTKIGKYAFIDFENVSDVQLSQTVSTINDAAFYNCDMIETITIPSTVTSIGFNGFGSCNRLSKFLIESGNKHYSSVDGNLYDISGKTLILYAIGKTDSTVIIPDGVTVIYDDAFENSDYITEIRISNSVISIGKWAFEYCKNLKKVVIPPSVTTIGENAFDHCSTELILIGSEQSYAKKYALENNISFSAE